MIIGLLLYAASAGAYEYESLIGDWCLLSTSEAGQVLAINESWTFNADQMLVIDREPRRIEAAVDLVNGTLQTSAALQMTILNIADDAMSAVNGDTTYQFTRGLCQ